MTSANETHASGRSEGGIERVCIRAPNWVGDVVMATPAIRAIRERFRGAHMALVVHSRVEAVLRGAPWFDEVIVYDPDESGRLCASLACIRRLRAGRFELGLVFPNSFRSALMMRLGGVKRRVGYARDVRSALLTDAVPRRRRDGRFLPTYMVDYYLRLCEAAGIGADSRDMALPFTEADRQRADRILRSQATPPGVDLFLLHPGAAFGPSKRWPTDRFARLAELLREDFGARVAIIASPAERDAAEAIVMAAGVPITDLSACGIDLHLLKCVIARSRLLVTTDSGPRHYGVALGVPTVCIMGPTHPAYSTSGLPHDHVVRLDVDCGPCQRKACPRDHRCMENIEPEMVMDTCRSALAATGVRQ